MTDAHFRCSFVNADPFVVPNTLSGVILNLNTLESRPFIALIISPRPSSLGSFHPFVNFPVSYSYRYKANYIPSRISQLFALSDHKSMIFLFFLLYSTNGEAILNTPMLSLLRRQKKQTRSKWGMVHIIYIRHLSQCC